LIGSDLVVGDSDWLVVDGLPVTRPARTAADLLTDREDPTAVAQIVVDALRTNRENAAMVARTIASRAATFGYAKGDGRALLEWLLDLSGPVPPTMT
jgi:hypothetical protein